MAVSEEWVWVMTCPTTINTVWLEPELECIANCTQCPYKTPNLEVSLAVRLLEVHEADEHPPTVPSISPSSCTALTGSVKLPVVPSNVAKDSYGLLTKSASKVDKAPISADVARQASKAAKKARQKAARYETKKQLLAQKSSAEADSPLRRQTVL